MCETSKFGKGLTYCLGLFLGHQERLLDKEKSKILLREGIYAEMWFNAASDHLYELQIPNNYPEHLIKRLKDFQDKVLHFGHGFPKEHATESDIEWSLNEAKLLLIEIDKQIGVKTAKGDWE